MSKNIQEQIKTEWIKALRSGEFKQAKKFMRLSNYDTDTPQKSYCCLGVLTEIACRITGRDWWVISPAKTLSRELTALMGLRTDVGSKERGDSLATLNDEGSTFAEIADLLEGSGGAAFFRQEAP